MTALRDPRPWILVGLVAFVLLTNDVLHGGVAVTAYGVGTAVVLGVLLAVVYALLRECPVDQFAVAAGLLVLSPCALRIDPGQAMPQQDLVFAVGVGVCLLGLRRRWPVLVLVGLVTAVLGRQSAIAVVPVAAFWVLADPRWRAVLAVRARVALAASAVVSTVALFVAVRALGGPLAHDEPLLRYDSVLNLIGELPNAATELMSDVARIATPWMVPAVVIVTLIARVGVRRVEFRCWASLLVAVSIAAQPLMFDAAWLLPLACAAADLLGLWRCEPMTRKRITLAIFWLAVGSLHHAFSAVGPASPGMFLAVQAVVAVSVSWLVVRDHEPPPPPPRLLRGAGCRVYGYQPQDAPALAHRREFGIGLLPE